MPSLVVAMPDMPAPPMPTQWIRFSDPLRVKEVRAPSESPTVLRTPCRVNSKVSLAAVDDFHFGSVTAPGSRTGGFNSATERQLRLNGCEHALILQVLTSRANRIDQRPKLQSQLGVKLARSQGQVCIQHLEPL